MYLNERMILKKHVVLYTNPTPKKIWELRNIYNNCKYYSYYIISSAFEYREFCNGSEISKDIFSSLEQDKTK